MPTAASFVAVVLYLLPVVVVVTCRARRGRPLWALALDVPLAVSLDLLLVLALSRLVTLEVATLASRVIWAVGGAAYVMARRGALDAPAWPRSVGGGAMLVATVVGWASTWISMTVSRPYSIWDRKQHTPLSASLRGQTIPFENALEKGQALHYHFSGDAHGAMVQALSFDVVHSSLALSISHDILFGLIGVTLALMLRGLGSRGPLVALAATLATLLAGPYTLFRDGVRSHTDGYSILNYVSLSFRPHDALAGLLFLGFVGALAARASHESARVRDTAPALLISTAGLAISDEASLGLLGLATGAVWIVYPSILHPRRIGGIAILAGMLVAFIGPNLAFDAAIAPGAQHHTIALVPWRSPGCYTPSLPLSTAKGGERLLADLLPSTLLWAGGFLGALASSRRRVAPLVALGTGLLALSVLALTRLEVNHDPVESHRFMTGEIFLAPVLSVLALLSDRASRGGARWSAGPLAWALHAAGVTAWASGAMLGAASTRDWIEEVLPVRGHRQNHFFTTEDLYAIDCRRDFGATIGERASPRYLSKSIWYAYAGCQPTFAPARHENAQWALTIGNPFFDTDAARAVQKSLGPNHPMTVICQRKPVPSTDPVCAYATRAATCEDLGERLTRCTLTPAQIADVTR